MAHHTQDQAEVDLNNDQMEVEACQDKAKARERSEEAAVRTGSLDCLAVHTHTCTYAHQTHTAHHPPHTPHRMQVNPGAAEETRRASSGERDDGGSKVSRRTIIDALKRVRTTGPMSTQGDVVALSNLWMRQGDVNNIQTVIWWMLAVFVREPERIAALEKGGFNLAAVAAHDAISGNNRTFMPFFQRLNLSIDTMAGWKEGQLVEVAMQMQRCAQPQSEAELVDSYNSAVTAACRLKGVGEGYGSKHMLNIWLMVNGIKNPWRKFLKMGSGADKGYRELESVGLGSLEAVNAHLSNPVDAGELAYLLCSAAKAKLF